MSGNTVTAPKLGVSGGSRQLLRAPRLVYSRDDTLRSDKGAKPRVLIVEDDYLVGSQIEVALADAGFDVVGVAQSAEEALALAGERKPQLAIMDIRLSGARDGVDTAVALYKAHGVRSVFATAHSDENVRRRAVAADPLGWIQKPYSMRTLVDAIRGALDDIGA